MLLYIFQIVSRKVLQLLFKQDNYSISFILQNMNYKHFPKKDLKLIYFYLKLESHCYENTSVYFNL